MKMNMRRIGETVRIKEAEEPVMITAVYDHLKWIDYEMRGIRTGRKYFIRRLKKHD